MENKLSDSLLQTSQDANTTISMLKFTPTIDDSGKYLSCRGEQPLIPDSGIESGWKLDIHRKYRSVYQMAGEWGDGKRKLCKSL